MKQGCILLKSKVYDEVNEFLKIEDLDALGNDSLAKKDSYSILGEVSFDNGVVAEVALVSGITAYWVDVQLFMEGEPLCEPVQFYNIPNPLECEYLGVKYSIKLVSDEYRYSVMSYCWTNKNHNLNNENGDSLCEGGDLTFSVPLEWLVFNIENNKSIHPYSGFDKKLIGLKKDEVISLWDDEYTHEQGYKVFCLASDLGVVQDEETSHCEYCKGGN